MLELETLVEVAQRRNTMPRRRAKGGNKQKMRRIEIEVRDTIDEDIAGTREIANAGHRRRQEEDEGLRGAHSRKLADAEEADEEEGITTAAEEAAEEEELSAGEELAEEKEPDAAEQGCVTQKKAIMGRQLLGNQAIARVAGANHGGGRVPEMPAGLATGGSAEAHEDFTSARNSSTPSGSSIGSSRGWKNPVRRSNATPWGYQGTLEVRELVGNLSMGSSATLEREQRSQMGHLLSLSFRSSRVQGVGRGKHS